MSLILSGTDGLSDVDGSASTPAIRGTDANTGIFFPAADTIAFAEGGVEQMRITSAGDVGIGTTSPSGKLEVSGGQLRVTASSASSMFLVNPSTTYADGVDIQATYNGGGSFGPLKFTTSSTERMRISTAGTLFIGGTSSPSGTQRLVLTANGSAGVEPMLFNELRTGSATENYVQFYRNGSQVGTIQNTGTATIYNTSSDYRLKENVVPMTGALAKVSALKPVTYTWKLDGSNGQGFIAHELQAVVPDCVTGEKDAVDADGNIKPQGIDTSFLVATLTAAIQELKAIVDAQAIEIAELKAKYTKV